MQSVSFVIMRPIANARIIYQMVIRCHIVNVFCLMLDPNVVSMTIVQANWLVFATSASNHAKNCCHVQNRLVAVYWTVHQYVHWCANVQNYSYPMRMVNVAVSYCQRHPDVKKIANVHHMNHALIVSVEVRAIVDHMPHVWSKIIEQHVAVNQAMVAIRIFNVVQLDAESIRNVTQVKHVLIATALIHA